jgi:hypothetical protein
MSEVRPAAGEVVSESTTAKPEIEAYVQVESGLTVA